MLELCACSVFRLRPYVTSCHTPDPLTRTRHCVPRRVAPSPTRAPSLNADVGLASLTAFGANRLINVAVGGRAGTDGRQ